MKVRVSKVAVLTAIAVMSVSAQNMKFPQAKTYKGCIKPSIDQADMNTQLKAIYDDYKNRFRKTMNTPSGGYYYASPATNGTGLTVSEAHGWGMVITVMMAGYDSDAKKVFDGMVKVFDHYKTNQSGPNLMSWKINSDGDAVGR